VKAIISADIIRRARRFSIIRQKRGEWVDINLPWMQNYDPLHGPLSTIAAAVPIVVLLSLLAIRKVPAYVAALAGLAVSLAVAIGVIGMPSGLASRAALLGAAYGVLPIGWIVLNVMFLYQLTEARGVFVALQRTITGISNDRRLQLVLIAFCFGAFFEGAAGFGTPVAVTGAMLIGLGFPPLEASALSLIANTAPVAFGALATPVIALQGVSGLDLQALSSMIGRQLPFFSVMIPFWLIAAHSGFKSMIEVWPALFVAGITFAVPQFLVSNYHGPWLVDILAAACSMACLTLFLKVWQPANRHPERSEGSLSSRRDPSIASRPQDDKHSFRVALLPWIILTVTVFAWGTPQVKGFLNSISAPSFAMPGLDKMVLRGPPVLAKPTAESAVFLFNWLSASGTAILITAIISGFVLNYSFGEMIRKYVSTIRLVWRSLVTIAAMLALGYVTRYSGEDAILGLAFAHTGALYPFFAGMLGWLGVALTGSDTSSNVLFGSLQRITAEKLGLSPVLMAAANSSGGVMGKMIDAQSIVVASTATNYEGHEWKILRFVFWHSVILASLVGVLVLLQQYVFPGMIPSS
jgi:lactate permease